MRDAHAGNVAPNGTGGNGKRTICHGPRIGNKDVAVSQKGRLTMDVTLLSEADCGSELHEEHLCYIISQGFNLADEQGYLALVEDPAFRCNHCGRKARRAGNLCVPARL
jgi:hypothetical protein